LNKILGSPDIINSDGILKQLAVERITEQRVEVGGMPQPDDAEPQSEFDAQQFDVLQQQLEPAVRRFIRHLIGLSSAEDDIVQNVFIALYRNLHRITAKEKIRSYVYGIARNYCYDELRREHRAQTIELDAPTVDDNIIGVSNADNAQEGSLHLKLLYHEVRQAMEGLPEVQRQLLILYCEEELSYAEIADVMHISIGTVKSRLHYAKRALRSLLKPRTLSAVIDALA
jgi:RNA polymerase sigma-70 factor, ECF subfamily